MQIDRSNYEEWLTDWLDGKLNESQAGQLRLFLISNPDLKDEFDDRAVLRLSPDNKSFKNKNLLKRSSSELSETQYEHLCIAFLEGDLTEDQKSEMQDIIAGDDGRRKIFKQIQNLRLSPVPVSYKYKTSLRKRTTGHLVIRLSVIALSAAAVTLLLITTYLASPKSTEVKTEKTAGAITPGAIIQQPVINIRSGSDHEKVTRSTGDQFRNSIAGSQKPDTGKLQSADSQEMKDSLIRYSDLPREAAGKVPVFHKIRLEPVSLSNTLVALNLPVIIPQPEDDRPKLSKLFARVFREKILKETKPKDTPLKGYEIAEAGIGGLNKLLGWQMALDKKNDENGELQSVYFSSRILKFNAPVKKSEPSR